ncbi:Uncharacterized protein dnm_058010 [Desulfonema magnum]|uniref:Uncharacterized protein n=1 Tax=Desulfonema magnum TaxID=45655 RepID=A0A975GQC6_9BACT|nr:Uncharacterized protein dnm_058010 [Desulfonema magnum]
MMNLPADNSLDGGETRPFPATGKKPGFFAAPRTVRKFFDLLTV